MLFLSPQRAEKTEILKRCGSSANTGVSHHQHSLVRESKKAGSRNLKTQISLAVRNLSD